MNYTRKPHRWPRDARQLSADGAPEQRTSTLASVYARHWDDQESDRANVEIVNWWLRRTDEPTDH